MAGYSDDFMSFELPDGVVCSPGKPTPQEESDVYLKVDDDAAGQHGTVRGYYRNNAKCFMWHWFLKYFLWGNVQVQYMHDNVGRRHWDVVEKFSEKTPTHSVFYRKVFVPEVALYLEFAMVFNRNTSDYVDLRAFCSTSDVNLLRPILSTLRID